MQVAVREKDLDKKVGKSLKIVTQITKKGDNQYTYPLIILFCRNINPEFLVNYSFF